MAWFAIPTEEATLFHEEHFIPLVRRTTELQALTSSSSCSPLITKYELQLKLRSGEFDGRELLVKAEAEARGLKNKQTTTFTALSPGATSVKVDSTHSVRKKTFSLHFPFLFSHFSILFSF